MRNPLSLSADRVATYTWSGVPAGRGRRTGTWTQIRTTYSGPSRVTTVVRQFQSPRTPLSRSRARQAAAAAPSSRRTVIMRYYATRELPSIDLHPGRPGCVHALALTRWVTPPAPAAGQPGAQARPRERAQYPRDARLGQSDTEQGA